METVTCRHLLVGEQLSEVLLPQRCKDLRALMFSGRLERLPSCTHPAPLQRVAGAVCSLPAAVQGGR